MLFPKQSHVSILFGESYQPGSLMCECHPFNLQDPALAHWKLRAGSRVQLRVAVCVCNKVEIDLRTA